MKEIFHWYQIGVLLDVLIQQFHAGRVWCSLRYDQDGYDDEMGGRTDTGQSFDLKSDTIKKLIERACEKQQFLLLSNVKQETVKQKAQSVIIAPIIASSGTLGVVCIESKLDRPPFTLSDLDYAMLLSISLGIILENF